MDDERFAAEMVKAKKILSTDGIRPVVKLFTERFGIKPGLNSITNLVAMLLYCGLNYEHDAFKRFIDLFTQKINDEKHPFVPTMMITFTDLLLNWSELLKSLIFTDVAECKSVSGSTAACATSDALESSVAISLHNRQQNSYKNALSCTALYLQKRNIFTRDTIVTLLDNVKQMLIFRVYMPPPPLLTQSEPDRSSELMQFARSAFDHQALLQFDRANAFKDLPDVTIMVNACSQPPSDTFSSGITRLKVSSTFDFEPDPMHTLMDELVPSQSLLAVTSLHNALVEELNKKLDSQTRFRTKQSGIAKKAFETAKDYCSEAEENLENVRGSKNTKQRVQFVKEAEQAAVRANKAADSAEAVYLEVEASVASTDEICEKLLSAENIFLTKISNSSSFSIDVDVESKKNDKKAEIDAKKAAAQTAATDIQKFATDARVAATAAEAAATAAAVLAKAADAAAPVPKTAAEKKALIAQANAAAEAAAAAAAEAAEKKRVEAAEKKRVEAAAAEQRRLEAAAEKKRLEAAAAEKIRVEAAAAEKIRVEAAALVKKNKNEKKAEKAAYSLYGKVAKEAAGRAAGKALYGKAAQEAAEEAAGKASSKAAEQQRAYDVLSVAEIDMGDFQTLFKCQYDEMNRIASVIRELPDGFCRTILLRGQNLTKYMSFDETFSRTFIVVGILQQYLQDGASILVTGKTASQLTAVLNDARIETVNSHHPPFPVYYESFAPGVCLFKPCSDVDIRLLLPVPATESLKKTFIATILLFFKNFGVFQNIDGVEVLDSKHKLFRQSPNTLLVVGSRGSPDTISVKKNTGQSVVDVLDVNFQTHEKNLLVFPNYIPTTYTLDTVRSSQAITFSELTFTLPDLLSLFNECIQITIKELTKLLTNRHIAYNESYFFAITTLLKFFSRAVQFSYIMANKRNSTRSIFDTAVTHYGVPNQETKNCIDAILNLFLIDDYTLNLQTFYDFAMYKATAKNDWKARVPTDLHTINLHTTILDILQRYGDFIPPSLPNLMGGKKNKLKTKRKARKPRKTRKTRKPNKSKNNNKKRFTRNIPPYKLTNKSRVQITRKC
jgi:hypothetical protein